MERLLEAVESRLREKFRGDGELPGALELAKQAVTWNAEEGKLGIEDRLRELTKRIEKEVGADLEKLKEILEGAD